METKRFRNDDQMAGHSSKEIPKPRQISRSANKIKEVKGVGISELNVFPPNVIHTRRRDSPYVCHYCWGLTVT